MTKKFLTLLTLLTLFFVVGRATTVTVTKTMNEIVAENGYTVSSESDINIYTVLYLSDNVAFGTTGEPNCGTFWGTSTIEWRLYENKNGNLVIGTTQGLQSVTITYSDASTGVLTYNGNDVPSGTAIAVSGNSVSFSIRSTTAASGQAQVGITSISVTYEKETVGDWHLVTSLYDIAIGRYEYIIVDNERTKVAGSYENGHFTALPSEGNVVFCGNDVWGYATATVTGDDVKIFTLEKYSNNYTYRDCYLKDADGNYYYLANGNIGNSKQLIEFTLKNGQLTIASYNNKNYKIGYNTDESYFGSYSGDAANYSGIKMYYRPKPMTLKEMREDEEDGLFKISNELQVVKAITRISNQNGYQEPQALLICKDDGPSCEATDMSIISDNCEDYMTTRVGFSGDWDQSNWALVNVRVHSLNDFATVEAFEGMRLAGNCLTLKRTGTDKDNIASVVDLDDLVIAEGSQPTTYTPNLYCPANFLRQNHNGNATGHDAEGNQTEDHYFFMNPKLQELCEITYAMWVPGNHPDGPGRFYLPPSDGMNNPANIYGEANVDWSLNNDPIYDSDGYIIQDWPDGLEEGGVYRFKAIVFGPWAWDRADINYDDYYTIYPIEFDPAEHIITGIKDVVDVTDKTVAGVKYYNLAGIESDRPFEGVNIVVTTYTDGSRSSSKVLK